MKHDVYISSFSHCMETIWTSVMVLRPWAHCLQTSHGVQEVQHLSWPSNWLRQPRMSSVVWPTCISHAPTRVLRWPAMLWRIAGSWVSGTSWPFEAILLVDRKSGRPRRVVLAVHWIWWGLSARIMETTSPSQWLAILRDIQIISRWWKEVLRPWRPVRNAVLVWWRMSRANLWFLFVVMPTFTKRWSTWRKKLMRELPSSSPRCSWMLRCGTIEDPFWHVWRLFFDD